MLLTRFSFALALALAAGGIFRSAGAQEAVVTPAALPAAPAAAVFMSELVLTQYVQTDSNGRLQGELTYLGSDGSLRSLPNQEVSLVLAGRFVERAMTNPDGEFSFGGVKPGIYTVVASNPKQLLVLPVVVTGSADEPASLALVAAGPIAPSRRQAMLAALLMGNPNLGVAYDEAQDYQADHHSATIGRVAIGGDGALQGRISVIGHPMGAIDMRGMTVRATRGGDPVASVPVEGDGTFVIPNMSPGPVSIFAFGPQGFAAIGVEVVAAEQLTQNISNGTETLVTAMQAPPTVLQFEIAPPLDVLAATQLPGDSFNGPVLPPGPLGPAPGMGGPLAGPGGGFGGGGAGGGGFGGGGLGALGALGVAAAALANDDDNNFVPVPASPAF